MIKFPLEGFGNTRIVCGTRLKFSTGVTQFGSTTQVAPFTVPLFEFEVASSTCTPLPSSNFQYPTRPLSFAGVNDEPILLFISVPEIARFQKRNSSIRPWKKRKPEFPHVPILVEAGLN